MTPGAGGAQKPPNSAVERQSTTNNSLHVNPSGTPRSPPPLRHEQDIAAKDTNNAASLDTEETDETDLKNGKSRSTRFIKDPAGRLTHDETTVDIVTVPCPGGDALGSWNRDGLLGRYFGAPSMRDAEVERTGTGASWVRQGIRREADMARILLYAHPPAVEGTTLGQLADVLLEELRALRDDEAGDDGLSRQRPLVFIGHSLGGLVVKVALAKASRQGRYEDIRRDCYGVVFFGEFLYVYDEGENLY